MPFTFSPCSVNNAGKGDRVGRLTKLIQAEVDPDFLALLGASERR